MKKCSYCGLENTDDAEVCVSCYTILPEAAPQEEGKKQGKAKWGFSFGKKKKADTPAGKTCPVCGSSNDASEQYCVACGSELGSAGENADSFSGTPTGGTKICPVCFAENSSDAYACVACGSELESEPDPVPTPRFDKKKAIFLAGGVAAAALLVGGVTMIAGNFSSPVEKSMSQMGTSLSERMDQMTTVQEFLENAEQLNEDGTFAVEIDLDTETAELSGTVYYDRSGKILSGSVEWEDDTQGIDTTLSFSADDDVVMFKIPESPDTYGCSLTEFSKTQLAQLLPVKIDGEMLKNLYKKADTSDLSGDAVKKAWKKLMQSMKYEESSASDAYPGCRVYHISWDAKAAGNLMDTVTDQAESSFDLIAGAENVAVNLLGDWGSDAVSFVVAYLEEDAYLYINGEDQIVALDFTVKPIMGLIGEGDIWTFRVNNPSDPWSDCTLTSHNGTASGYFRSDAEGAELMLDLNVLGMLELDVNGSYDDSTGAFGISLGSGGSSVGLTGKVISRNGSAKIELEGDMIGMGYVDFIFGLDNLDVGEIPQSLSSNGKYVDITDSKNWERFKTYINH